MARQMTIGKKLSLGFTAVLVLTTILATVGIVQIGTVDTGLMDLADVHTPLTAAITSIDAAATNQNLQVSLYAIHKEQVQLDNFDAADSEVDENFEAAANVIKGDQELVDEGWLNTVEAIAKEHDLFVTACRDFIEVVKNEASTDEQIMTAADGVEDAYDPFMDKVDTFLATNDEEVNNVSAGATAAADAAKFWMITIGIAAVAVGIVLAFVISRGLIKTLTNVINALSEGSEQVSSASGQVSSASQSLAEGATEQAAGLEETSSSLEEMASMTKQNADNAQQANTLAGEARKAADTGAGSMGKMNDAIQEIQKSSDETAKIIKVIDEIAFQTNLLALNAAVEAARAGEAGKGFAVVAEEVRNLAMRSAEAAKNTSEMIEDSVKNAKNGVDIANEVGKVLTEIVEGIGKTSDLVGEIAAASQEQAQGIDQVNTAVNQMDKVTQANAANAEESASASEELTAQAEQMKIVVGELVALVGGSASRQKTASAQSKANHTSIKQHLTHSDHTFHQIAAKTDDGIVAAVSSAKTTTKQAIPLDDNDDFKDFNS